LVETAAFLHLSEDPVTDGPPFLVESIRGIREHYSAFMRIIDYKSTVPLEKFQGVQNM
jgi:hypothetical protein